MKLKIDKDDCITSELKVPEGYRIIEDWELMRELRTNKQLQKIFKNGIWVNRVMGVRASWLYYFNNGNSIFFAGDRLIINSVRVRGVFVEIDEK